MVFIVFPASYNHDYQLQTVLSPGRETLFLLVVTASFPLLPALATTDFLSFYKFVYSGHFKPVEAYDKWLFVLSQF